MTRPILPALLILALSTAALAQNSSQLTLQDAIRDALKQRPLLQADTERIGLARARITEAKSRLLPQVDLEGSITDGPKVPPPSGLRGPTGSLFSQHATAAVNVVQTLLDFGRTHNLVRARREDLSASKEALEADRNQVTLDVTRAYLQALQAQRLLAVNQQIQKERELVVRQAEALMTNDLASRVDVDLAKLNVSQARLAVVRAGNDIEVAYASLSAAIGRVVPSTTPLQDITASETPQPSLDESIAAGLKDRPEIRGQQAQLRAAQHLVSAARAEKKPLVAAFGSVGKLNPLPEFDTADQPYAVGVGVSVPLFTGGLFESQIEQARRNAAAAQSQLAELSNAVRQQVTSSLATLAAANESVTVAKAQLTVATDALKLAEKRYASQLGTIVELSQAQVGYATAQNDYIRATYDQELARAALAFATGRSAR